MSFSVTTGFKEWDPHMKTEQVCQLSYKNRLKVFVYLPDA